MGNNHVVSRENLLAAEARVLALSGLSPFEIKTYDLEIWDGCSIRTTEVGFPFEESKEGKKPIMVFMHGYNGSGAVFYEIMKPLAQHFHTIFIDIIGMGCSSREPY